MGDETLLIRADANVAMGTGHVMRCLALAQAWQDAGGRAGFAMAEMATWVQQRLLQESVPIFEVSSPAGTEEDARSTAAIAREQAAAWVVVDGYQFGPNYPQLVKAAGFKILFLDDYGHAEHYVADLVLNQNVSADANAYENRTPYTRLLLGPAYCLLRREFNAWREWKREFTPAAHRVLVTMGGSDPENFTQRAIEALNLVDDEELEAAIVVGGSNAHAELLDRIASQAGKKISVQRGISNMAELMAWADIAVSAAGTTCWEMCLMGLPALLIDLAENQTPVARELNRRGCAVHLGGPGDVSSTKLAGQVERLLNSMEERRALSLRCRELVDGKGAQRVVSAMGRVKLRLRPAGAGDRRLLWEWVNDPQVRAASFSSAAIPWKTHDEWFTEKLESGAASILIAENDEGTPVGQIRFDLRADGEAEIAISIAKSWRGRGLAAVLIRQAQSGLSGGRCPRLHAYVKPENVASVKAFEKGGFKQAGIARVRGNAAVHLICEVNQGSVASDAG